MPYTPPAQRSPAASRPDSPQRTRDGLGMKPIASSSPFLSGPRPNLPRSNSSTSYIHRQRRSPSSPLPVSSLDHEAAKNSVEGHDWAPHASLRQSPPPINNHAIPTGTIISPPDSGDNSSDDEGLTMAGRGKKLTTLVDLQAAISVIEKERESKPDWADEEKRKTRAALGLDIAAADPNSGFHALAAGGRLPLSKEARKISHSRSATETNIQLPRSQSYSPVEGSSDSDELDDETAAGKPKMLRKKSGELVRPALRPASARRRPSSMPGTPTFSKAVHFSSDLEHVRHFLQVDKPLAVSAETSPVDMMEDESEYPFPGSSAGTATEWELRLANFPAETLEVQRAPVKVERVFLSSNKKTLIGTVAVQNLAFNKQVIARFTYDYWKTTSEVSAEFSHDVRRQQSNDGLDRFNFNLQLADQNNLENKTLFFCVRYVVNGQEFWDSNNGVNYQVDFSKKKVTAPQGKPAKNEASQHLNGLPRSRSPQQSPRGRRNFDDFGIGFDSYWSTKDPLPRAQSAVSLLEDNSAPLKFRSKASGNAFEDLPGRRQARGPAQALGNRYDFNKSLSAALTAASNALGERSGLAQTGGESPIPSAAIPATSKLTKTQSLGQTPTLAPARAQIPPSPSPQNLSYEELVEKFCFFGNGNGNNVKMQSTPPKSARPCSVESSVSSAQSDGAASNVMTKPAPASPSPTTSPMEIVQAAVESVAERLSRSTSPSRSELSSRAVSPIPLASFYHQPLGSGFVTPTAIQG